VRLTPAAIVRIAEYDPLLRPDPEVNDPSPNEYRGSIPFLAANTARLSPARNTLAPVIPIFDMMFSGNEYPIVILFMDK
jgi:hypothetical protein